MQSSFISVVMAVHNGARFLTTAIDSILQQTYPHFEFIIIDDASTDQTAAILSQAAQQDRRVQIITNPTNLGLTKSLNIGINAATGVYIARHDADDIALPERFATQVAYLDQHPQVVLAASYYDIINEGGEVVNWMRPATHPMLIRWGMLFYNHLAGHSQMMFRRETMLALGGYNEARRYSQDYELWLRMIQAGEVVILPQVLQQWRQHGSSVSFQKTQEQAHLSLLDSQHALQQLIGAVIDLDELARLRGFFIKPFPAVSEARLVHTRLHEIYRNFLNAYQLSPGDPDANAIRQFVGERFIRWTRSQPLYHRWGQKLQVGQYALRWSPLELIKNWSGWN